MKFLLLNPTTGDRRMPAYFPLGLAYIAGVLTDSGHKVQALDFNAERCSPEEVERRLRAADFDVAGITGLVTEFRAVRRLSELVKAANPEATVILGGGLPTAFPRLVLERTQADIAVIGEGEVTIRELAEQLRVGAPLDSVHGIWYRQGEALQETPPRGLIEDLDTVRFPARHLFPMERYTQNPVPYLRMFDRRVVSTNVISSRGCPYRCAYCFHGLWGHRFRARSADNVVAEIKVLHDKFGIDGIFFMDDTFVLNRKRVLAICDRLVEEDMGISWVASARVNLVDEELLDRMRAAGCRAVLYGIESGSQRILDEMGKGVTVEQARKAVLETWQADILPIGFLMIGMFGETRETVGETVRFCNETGLVSGFSYATPFPGTDLYERAVEVGKIGEDDAGELLETWREWTDEILVNLSDIPDDELKSIKREAQRRIFWGKWWQKMHRYIQVLGARNAVGEAVRFVKKGLRIGRFT